MKIYLPVALSVLLLSGCATDTLKNEHAVSVINAGNKTVDANAEFFKAYYASREKYIVNFYATNPDCTPTPDYVLTINSQSSGLCQTRNKVTGASTGKNYKIHLVPMEKGKLLASLEVIQSMSAYTELLTKDRDVDDSQSIVLLNKALDHANNAKTLMGLPEDVDVTGAAKAIQDLTTYFNELYKEKERANNIGKTVDRHWPKMKTDLMHLRDDIATKSESISRNTFAGVVDSFHYYGKMKNTEFKTYKSKQEFLGPAVNVNENRLRMSDPAAPAIQAINTFIAQGENLHDLYRDKTLSDEDLKRKKEIIRQQIVGGLQASEGLAKLLIKSGLIL